MHTDRTLPAGPGARYHRVSTSGQDTERQEADIDRWLASVGAECSHTYTDHDSRDKSEERYDFQRLMGAVRAKAVTWVVVQTIDRLGFKDTYEFFHFIDVFRDNGVQLWSAIDNACISHADDARILTNAIAGLTSTKEQIEKANRIQTKRLEKAKRGEYQGGFAPYAMDVICRGPEGREKFRYVLVKAARRIGGRKPNGRVEYCTTIEGRKITPTIPEGEPCTSVPAHDRGDILTLAPTVLKERIEVVRRIFLLLDIEATNPTRVAALLNKEGVECPTGDLWTDPKIRHLVKNPVYMGKPTLNKGGQPRFFEIKGGRLERIEGRGKAKHIRRDRTEWLMPERPLFEPIITEDLWERVNRKIEPRSKRAPRNEELYLSGLLYCGKCGLRMFGFMIQRRSKRDNSILGHTPYYQCATRNKFGYDNPTGCRFNSTRNDVIEALILSFLAKRGQTLDDIIGSRRDARALERLLVERSEHSAEARSILDRMRGFVRRHLPLAIADGINDGDGVICPVTMAAVGANELPSPEDVDSMSIVDLYDLVSDHRTGRMEEELADLEADHSALAEKITHLKSPLLIERLDAQASAIESRIIALRSELEPLSQRWDTLQQDLYQLRQRLSEAEVVMRKGSNRMKAQALRACIQRINCWFDHSPGGKSILKRVEIVPQIGEPQTVEVSPSTVFPSNGTHRRARG